MTRVTYLSHTGFVVTLDEVILVFDYVHDPAHTLKRILEDKPDTPVIFFISHKLVNNNHFNPGTFEIGQNHRRVFIVSNSLPAMYIPDTLEVQGMNHGDVVEGLPGNISVKAYDTTDKDKYKGVCFVVTTASGEKIFHGGHLNNWDMPDETSKEEAHNSLMRFTEIVNRIAEDNPTLDIAMMCVNPRISLDFAEGAREFTSKIKVKDFFPMDMDDDALEACKFDKYLPEGTAGHCLKTPGKSAEL